MTLIIWDPSVEVTNVITGAKFNKGAKCNKDHNTGIRNGSQGLHSYVQEMGSVIKRHFCRTFSTLGKQKLFIRPKARCKQTQHYWELCPFARG